MRGLGATLFADSIHRRGHGSRRPSGDAADRCDFCESPTARWRHPTRQGQGWKACDACHAAIVADDREALNERASLGSTSTTFPHRHAPNPRDRTPTPSEDFWSNRAGVAEPLHA
jgi:hypothetical protein